MPPHPQVIPQAAPAARVVAKGGLFFHGVALLLLTVFSSTLSRAAEYHVSPAGSDSNLGSAAAPFREIRKALTVITPGDTIIVADGSYKGFDAVGLGSATATTTLIAPGRNAVITKTTDRGINNPFNIQFWQCTRVVFDGFRSFNADKAGVRIVQCSQVTVRNGVFGDNQYWGIVTSFCDDLLIEGNDCYGSKKEHGIYVSNSGDRPVVRGNRLHHNVASGLRSNGDVIQGGDGIITGAVYENNIIHDNGSIGGAAMNLDGLQDGIIRNNLIYNNAATGIALFKGGGAEGPKGMQVLNNTIVMPAVSRYNLRITDVIGPLVVRNNVLYNSNTVKGPFSWNTPSDAAFTDSDYNAFGGGRFVSTDGESTRISMDAWIASGHETHSLASVSLPALFANEAGGDYRLKTDSPLTDRALQLNYVPVDILGTARPVGPAPDIGAYEYGLYGAWKTGHQFPVEAPTTWDSDQDGVPLLMEYALDLDPQASSVAGLPMVTTTATHLRLSYSPVRPDVLYAVETSHDLTVWTLDGVDQGAPGPLVTASVPLSSSLPRQFLRLRVDLP